jgi:CRISPR-associated protein (TIGR02584 family)
MKKNPKSEIRNPKSAIGTPPSALRPPQSALRPPPSTLNPQPSTILLAVTGMSPAVLTETLWALAQETEPIIPARVVVVTTADGRREMERQLFGPAPRFGGRTPWDTLRAALSAAGHDLRGRLRFGTTGDDLRVITAADPATGRTRELTDLRTAADNEAAADFLLEQVRSLVENPDTQLVVSIAGGRKTMGALLYACLTLTGRDTDRLTHVLVSDPFETLRDFWFPGQPGGPLLSAESRKPKAEIAFDPATAKVELADVPFVPLRSLFLRELGRKVGTFSRLVETCRAGVRHRAAENLRLSLDTARAELEVNAQTFRLAPTEMLLALFLARRAKQAEPPFAAYKDALDALNAFREEQVAAKKDFADWRHAGSLRANWEEREIVKAVSSLREKLRHRGGDATLLAACLPEKGRCSLDVVGPLIHLKP